MSEVTKYQFFLDTMKFILKLKNILGESEFAHIVEEGIKNAYDRNNVSNEDEQLLRDFLFHLEESTFYDDCMKMYCTFSKYETDFKVNFLHFYKLKLADSIISMS